MQDNEKIYRIELTNEEYEFLENLRNIFLGISFFFSILYNTLRKGGKYGNCKLTSSRYLYGS